MSDKKFVNIDERYGDQVEATIEDYRELNPDGEFIETLDEIIEYDENGNHIVVASVVTEE